MNQINENNIQNSCSVRSMHTVGINNCLAARWHALYQFLQVGLWQGIPCLLNDRTNRFIRRDFLLIVILNLILHPVPYRLDRIQIGREGRPFENTDMTLGKLSERFSCPMPRSIILHQSQFFCPVLLPALINPSLNKRHNALSIGFRVD
jgi:hypothetical protein